MGRYHYPGTDGGARVLEGVFKLRGAKFLALNLLQINSSLHCKDLVPDQVIIKG